MSEVATVQGRSGGGRAARSMATFAAGQGYLLLGALSGFVATPLVLNWLGDTRFGAFRAAADWLGYLELVELGISGALPVLLARAWGEGDRNALHAAMVAGARAYAGIAPTSRAERCFRRAPKALLQPQTRRDVKAKGLVIRMIGEPVPTDAADRPGRRWKHGLPHLS